MSAHTPDIGLPGSGAAYWAAKIATTKPGTWVRSEAEQGHAEAVAMAISERDRLRADNAALLAALKHALHWHDQLRPHDIEMMRAAVARAEASK